MKKYLAAFILLSLLPFQAIDAQEKRPVGVHDPVVAMADGSYYLFCTGRGIASWKSDDLVEWNYLGRVFDSIPAWCKEEVPKFDGNIWAPDIFFHEGSYYLYYSISSFASNRSVIGVATNKSLDPDDPDFKWIDHGKVVESYPGRDHWNAIDPNIITDSSGTAWMSFGSFWGGLKLVKLSEDLLSVAKPEEWATIAIRDRSFGLLPEDPGDGAIEAPFIIKKDAYYYLFASYDLCCRGARSNYNVRVGRSMDLKGPYMDKDSVSMQKDGGSFLVGPNEEYFGIGHNSIYKFGDQYYFFTHAYEKANRGRSRLLVYTVDWDEEGWPVLTLSKEAWTEGGRWRR